MVGGTPKVSIAQPRLSIDKTAVDLGVIYSGASKSTRLRLKNTGSDTLKIFRVETSCGCTTIKQPRSFLLPGESDALEVALNSTGLLPGKAKKYVTIETNDPSSTSLSVVLSATILEEFETADRRAVLWLGNLLLGKSVQRTVSFKNVSGRPIAIKGVTSSSPKLTLETERKTVMPSDSVRVTVTVTPQEEGYFSGQFFLETNSKNQPRVSMRVTYTGVKPR
jgi:hypothetical protein